MSLNVTTMIGHLVPMLHAETTADLIWWTDAQITRWFADFLKRHAEADGVFVLRHVATLIDGQATYNAPPRHLDTIYVAVDGRPLVASTTTELEGLDDGFRTTAETTGHLTSRWYSDRLGANRIGLYPVPAATFSDGADLEIIYHGFPCNLDEAHTDTAIDVPPAIGDALELAVIAEAYGTESDATMPEVTANLRQVASFSSDSLIRRIVQTYWGRAQ